MSNVRNRSLRGAFAFLSFIAVSISSFAATAPTVVTKRPFPQHVVYAHGAIKPKVAQATLDSVTGTFYRSWKTKYLRHGCGAGRYYIFVAEGAKPGDVNIDPNTLTVSEGHGYGMMIFAWMAGYDVNAKTYFDGMVRYWKDHQAVKSPGLMAWKQMKGCKNATEAKDGDDGSTSATDGDLDIAYAFLLADKQWGSSGRFNYRQEANKVILAALTHETNPLTHHNFPGRLGRSNRAAQILRHTAVRLHRPPMSVVA